MFIFLGCLYIAHMLVGTFVSVVVAQEKEEVVYHTFTLDEALDQVDVFQSLMGNEEYVYTKEVVWFTKKDGRPAVGLKMTNKKDLKYYIVSVDRKGSLTSDYISEDKYVEIKAAS
ncbi:hypothetical protein IMZ31_21600 (plasmid) [Pontibacillus sp. ALD_SL1]|uniref:hypothetical protein n=1 Tax=Pontibacillus sp. ALD_SL1 TaxID=2777185 RepID=UPI001A974322|nr:hypothetical protein [Pontibacillus sp. ALD_SL1]QST02048.1 hypothetical protein IMZ31_21600 [Pontibacillus sp. ALD_SL1]